MSQQILITTLVFARTYVTNTGPVPLHRTRLLSVVQQSLVLFNELAQIRQVGDC